MEIARTKRYIELLIKLISYTHQLNPLYVYCASLHVHIIDSHDMINTILHLSHTCIGADVSVYNPLSASPFSGEFRFNESDADTTVTLYVSLNLGANVVPTLQRNVDVLISTSAGTAGV